MAMIERFLELEVLLSPEVYEFLKNYNKIVDLINKIKEFKKYNKRFILLDKKFLDIFLTESLEDIIENYKDFDFIKYYTGEEDKKEEKIEKEKKINEEEIIKKIEELNKVDKDKKIEDKNKYLEDRKRRFSYISKIKESVNSRINWIAKDIEEKIEIYEDSDVTGKSTCTGTIEDFIEYFKDRYERLKKFIIKKANRKPIDLDKINKYKGYDDIFVVGIVSEVSYTKTGHLRVKIEDTKDEATLLIPKEKIDNKDIPDDILLDEVIGAIGKVSNNNMIIVDKIIRPSITPKPPKKINEQIYMMFLSDIHIGSKEFLHREFEKLIKLLNGDVNDCLEEKVVSRLKYICIAGDLVDGVGVYPGQEEDLYEIDILSQYEEIALYLEQIPEHISIIISPGNHDAVRPAEPQPRLPDDIIKLFNRDNMYFVGNPCCLNIHGFDTLLYHGRSFDDLVSQIKTASYENPATIMRELIKRRLLCPTYGGRCPIAPEHKDYLVIDRDIDILHTGHIHINGYDIYRGVVLVNSGTFQEQTDFQKRMGISPTPAIVPIIDLSKVGDIGHYLEWDRGILEVRY
ncbi:DNA-directed DNA polymerase II small subunit [Methanocaldococcus indicus]|uniref:DNA-directed DNA polymerase II small subunit n=1 Tax=Methanocaldococcus indicus TaxID=213231 RepID=UPI003C6D252F